MKNKIDVLDHDMVVGARRTSILEADSLTHGSLHRIIQKNKNHPVSSYEVGGNSLFRLVEIQ